MQKLSQTEELARTLAARARHHALTPEQISRAMDERDFDVAQLDELYTALEARGVHLAEADDELLPLDEGQIGKLEQQGKADSYVFGFEESYGCLIGTYARDKDAISATAALCEAAAYYKQKGMTLWDAMIAMY